MKEQSNKLKKICPGITNGLINAYAATGGIELIKYLDDFDYSTATQAIATTIIAGGMYAANKSGLIKKISNTINDSTNKIKGKVMPYIKAGLLAGAIGFLPYINKGNIQDISSDLEKKISQEKDKKGYIIGENEKNRIERKDEKDIITHSRLETKGKFERTYRWDDHIDEVEEKNNIEKGVLAGLIMRESYGNPLQLNSGNDGGAGLMMFQPGTAQEWGLKTYGQSKRTGRDKSHGEELLELVKKHNYNYETLAEIDERFHVQKSIEAGGKFLAHLKERYGTWDKAISAYNLGKPAKNPKETNHVKMTRYYQNYYNKLDKK